MPDRRILSAIVATLAFSVFFSFNPALAADDSDAIPSSNAVVTLTNFQAASVVIGQANFAGGDPNQGNAGPSADTIDGSFGNVSVGPTGILYLSDYNNQRVLGFDTIPTSNDASADFVLGQPNFTSAGGGTAANQVGGPQTTAFNGGAFLVDDFFNHRVLIWKKAPTSTQVPATAVIGQKTFGTRNSGCTAKSLNAPETISVGRGKLVVADSSNARVLIFKKVPKKSGKAANIVLGQSNLTTCVSLNDGTGKTGAPTAANFSYPAGVWTDGVRIVVSDEDENRVLIWNKFPKKSFTPADVVLGQPDFVSEEINNDGSGGSGAPSANNMNGPYDGVFSNGTQLFVVDQMNQRVLVWNKFPTTNFTPADVVLGQPNFTCGVRNNDGTGCTSGSPSASNLQGATGVFQVGGQLIVTDGGNSRFLIFN